MARSPCVVHPPRPNPTPRSERHSQCRFPALLSSERSAGSMSDEREVFSNVVRFEVIDQRSGAAAERVFVALNARIEPSVQDDGRTLKIFVVDQKERES